MRRIEGSQLYLSVKSTVENPEKIAIIKEIFELSRHGRSDTCPWRLLKSNREVEIPEYFVKFQPDSEKSRFDKVYSILSYNIEDTGGLIVGVDIAPFHQASWTN